MDGAPELTPFALLLRRYRQAAGLTQEELAERARLSARGISDLERGLKHAPRKFTVLALAEALALSQEERVALEAAARAMSDRHREAEPGSSADPQQAVVLSEEPFVFLAYARADETLVDSLVDDLQARGVAVWTEREGLKAGTPRWEQAQRAAIRAAQAVVVLVGAHTRASRDVVDELRIAEMYRREVQLVWVAGEVWEDCALPGWDAVRALDARGSRREHALVELAARLDELPAAGPAPPPQAQAAEPEVPPRNPYKGLRAFTGDDAGDFFGRDGLIQSLLIAMGTAGPRVLALVGPSGSGKSSVVLAGLLPRLRQGALPGSETWVYLQPLLPGAHPLEALTLSLANTLPATLHAIREDLDSTPRALHLLASRLAPSPGTPVLLVVDQCEELFTLTTDEDERRAFIDLLVTAVTEPRGPVQVLLTLRADFYDRPMSYPALGRLLEAHARSILPMALADLREAIERPAALPGVGLGFEADLVGDLLFEVRGQVGALPLLQFTLDQLVQHRQGRVLTLAAYRELGGVQGALARHAEATYAALAEAEQPLARALFLRLVDPGASEQDTTRRRAAMSELTLPDPQQTAVMQTVAGTFIGARLLTASEVAGVTSIEVSHEALIREWGRLAAWLREAREDIRLQQAISADTAAWQRRGEPPDRVYYGDLLDEATGWAARNLHSEAEQRFLAAGLVARERQEATERDQQARELALNKAAALANMRSAAHLRNLAGVLVLFLCVSVGLSVFAIRSAVTANRNAASAASARAAALAARDLATSRQLSAQALNHVSDQYDLALLLSLESNRIAPTAETRDSLLRTLQANSELVTYLPGHQGAVMSVAFSRAGGVLASGSADGTVRLWDVSRRQSRAILRPTAPTSIVNSVAFSPDGITLASGSDDGTIQLWRVATGTPLGSPLPEPGDSVRSLAFSLDGMMLASVSSDGLLRLWDVAGRRLLGAPMTDSVSFANCVAFSPNGRLLVTGSADGTLRLWDTSRRIPLGAPIRGHGDSVNSVAFSPNGRLIVSGSADRTVRLWDVASRHQLGLPLTGFGGGVTGVAFDPTGTVLAASSLDQSVRLWDVTRRKQQGAALGGSGGGVNGVAFSPDGTTLATGGSDATLRLWDVTGAQALGSVLGSQSDTVTSVAFSPSGQLLASGSEDRTVRLWDMVHRLPIGPGPASQPMGVNSVRFSPDSSLLAAGVDNGSVVLWPIHAGTPPGQVLPGGTNVESVAFSPDGSLIAAGTQDSTILLWDVKQRSQLDRTLKGHSDIVIAVAFGPDGKLLASGSQDKTIRLWDVAQGLPVGDALTGHGGSVNSVAFSPDGKLLASGSSDHTIRLWDVATRQPVGAPLRGHTDTVTSVAFSPDGSMLASGSFDGSVRLWDAESGQELGRPLRGHSDAVTSVAFSPGGTLLASGSSDHTVRLWDVSPASWTRRACGIANRNFTRGEWEQYLGTTPYRRTCPTLPEPPS